jgi:NADH:ubiquinone oxidoreductase subunit E
VLSEQSKSRIQRIRDEYPDAKSALLPALYLAQQDYGGWLPSEAFEAVAEAMGLPPTYVASTASFYTMLNRKPVGRHVIQVCTNISCSGSHRAKPQKTANSPCSRSSAWAPAARHP